MKIIHCSDLHLDSKMEANLTKEQARERKDEILITFKNMIEYAKKNKVEVIIIAGDLFDKNRVSAKAKNIVKDSILSNPDIDFLYLKGNHDVSSFIDETEIPNNLKLFSNETWKEYTYGNVVITGIELTNQDNYHIYNSLILSKSNVNIVVMHGQESEYDSKDKTEVINLNELKNKNINYLALGHIHSYKMEKLDRRGKYCYSGCLEGRGFDECGDKGFVLIDINKDDKIKTKFVKMAQRTLYEIEVDITGLKTTSEVEKKINADLKAIPKESLIKIILTGKVDIDSERDIKYLLKIYNEKYYFAKIYDKTSFAINYLDYEYDASLKGELIRLVLSQEDISDEEKKIIIETGIKALSGEEV